MNIALARNHRGVGANVTLGEESNIERFGRNYSFRASDGHEKSENYHHGALRNQIKNFPDVRQMEHHTAPGEAPRPVIAPFPRPTVKPDAAAQPGVFQRRRPFLPACRNRRFLLRRDISSGSSARRVIPVWIIDLDPMPAVVGAVSPVEFPPMFVDDKIHSLRSLVVTL